jgi:hypothetical protein
MRQKSKLLLSPVTENKPMNLIFCFMKKGASMVYDCIPPEKKIVIGPDLSYVSPYFYLFIYLIIIHLMTQLTAQTIQN